MYSLMVCKISKKSSQEYAFELFSPNTVFKMSENDLFIQRGGGGREFVIQTMIGKVNNTSAFYKHNLRLIFSFPVFFFSCFLKHFSHKKEVIHLMYYHVKKNLKKAFSFSFFQTNCFHVKMLSNFLKMHHSGLHQS